MEQRVAAQEQTAEDGCWLNCHIYISSILK